MRDSLSGRKSGYIPTLDGWRAVAIIAVMVYHTGPIVAWGVNLYPAQMIGRFGVQLFFAISGILICTRLLDEEEARGRISFSSFYKRRLFRIQPAALVFLATVALLQTTGTIPVDRRGILTAALSVRNFFHSFVPGDFYTAHFWSLGVEEHFYLLLPLLLVILRGRRRIAWFGLLTAISIGWSFYQSHRLGVNENSWRTDLEINWLFVPSLFALLLRVDAVRRGLTKYLSAGWVIGITVGGTLISALILHDRLINIFLLLMLSLMILATVLHPASWPGRILETKPFRAIGRISFSLYLWQQLFCLNRHEIHVEPSWLGALQRLPQSFAAALVLATISYFLVEKPLIRIGHRLSPPATAGHADLEVSTRGAA